MNKTKITLYIIFLLIFTLAIFAFVKFSDGLFNVMGVNPSNSNNTELINKLNESDCKVYWIGDVPDSVKSSGLVLSVLTPEQLSEQTLPFRLYSTVEEVLIEESDTEVETDEDTIIISSKQPRYKHVKTLHEGDCPEGATIVISTPNLTNDEYAIILRSLKEGDAVLYVFGEDAVRSLRSYLLMSVDGDNNYFSMKFTSPSNTKSGVMDNLSEKSIDSDEWFRRFLMELVSDI